MNYKIEIDKEYSKEFKALLKKPDSADLQSVPIIPQPVQTEIYTTASAMPQARAHKVAPNPITEQCIHKKN